MSKTRYNQAAASAVGHNEPGLGTGEVTVHHNLAQEVLEYTFGSRLPCNKDQHRNIFCGSFWAALALNELGPVACPGAGRFSHVVFVSGLENVVE